jgi:hypothetical protein
MIREVAKFEIVCDSCKARLEFEEWGAVELFDTRRAAELFVTDHLAGEWTADGEGKHHCPDCPPLEMTQAGADEIARRPSPNDVPLAGLEATR